MTIPIRIQQNQRKARRSPRFSRSLSIESLESRCVLATFVVNADVAAVEANGYTVFDLELNPGDGECLADVRKGTERLDVCFLQSALSESFFSPEADTIIFEGVGEVGPSMPDFPGLTIGFSDVTIDGSLNDGADKVVFRGMRVQIRETSNVTLRNVVVDGSEVPDPVSFDFQFGGILVESSNSVTIEESVVKSFVDPTSISKGFGIKLLASDNNIIRNNFVGLEANGQTPSGNRKGIEVAASSSNLLEGNVVSGNLSGGIFISSTSPTIAPSSEGLPTQNNEIKNNRIGTNAEGTEVIANSGSGISVTYSSVLDPVAFAPESSLIEGNLVVGIGAGVILQNTDGNIVSGNKVGVDITGGNALGNLNEGIRLWSANDTEITDNVVSGNGTGIQVGLEGILAGGQIVGPFPAERTIVTGNLVGTDATGTQAIPNQIGIDVQGGSRNNRIEQRNVISGNQNGIVIRQGSFIQFGADSEATDNIVRGNFIGTDISGTAAVPNLFGMTVGPGAHRNVVDGNVISGNGAIALRLDGTHGSSLVGSRENVITGNTIGMNALHTGILANGSGVFVSDANLNVIGVPGDGNVIWGNLGSGVSVLNSSTGNSIRGNVIRQNIGESIDLGGDGPTSNDVDGPIPDADKGPNDLQNYPTVTVQRVDNLTVVKGQLRSSPNELFIIDFYATTSSREAHRYLGSQEVSTDATGLATFQFSEVENIAVQESVVATATNVDGSTSEVEHKPEDDIVAVSLSVVEDSLELSYVADCPLCPPDIPVSFYWSTGPTIADAILSSAVTQPLVLSEATVSIPNLGGDMPREATHVLALIDPANEVPESDEDNNLQAFKIPLFTVNVTSFIPTDHVPGPPYATCFLPRPFRPEGPPVIVRPLVYEGDNRSFDPLAISYRTRQLVTIVPQSLFHRDGVIQGSVQNLVGPSRSFAIDALDDGIINDDDYDGVLNDCSRLHEEGVASNTNMHVSVTRNTPSDVSVHMFGGAANPLLRSAEINWDFNIAVTMIGEEVDWLVLGTWDGFPAVEVYIDNRTMYQYSPGPGPYGFLDLLKLFPGYGDFVFGAFGTFQSVASSDSTSLSPMATALTPTDIGPTVVPAEMEVAIGFDRDGKERLEISLLDEWLDSPFQQTLGEQLADFLVLLS